MNHLAALGSFVAALSATILSTAPALSEVRSNRAAVRPASTVTSIHGEQARPVSLPGHNVEANVASIHLPRGAWLVVADASAVNTDGSHTHDVVCDLVAGGGYDRNNPSLNRRGRHGNAALISLMVVHRFTASNGGHANMLCKANGPAAKVTIGQISVSAFRAGVLSTEPYLGPRTTSGSSSNGPRMLHTYNDGPVAIPGGFMHTEMAAFTVPAGNWVLFGKLYLKTTTPGSTGVSCGLHGGGDTASPLLFSGTVDGVTVSLITATHLPSPATVALACDASSATKAFYAKITAVRVGRLSQKDMGSNVTDTFGSGAPAAIAAFRGDSWRVDGGNVTAVHVPRGKWAVFGKASLEEQYAVGPRHVSCSVSGPGSRNTGRLSMKSSDRSGLFESAVPTFSRASGGTTALRCGTTESPSEVDASAAWIVAIKLHAVTRVTL